MISFVMLTWNRKQFLIKCLDSFYKNISAHCNYEFLLIDNGSDDGTVDILKNYESNDARLKVFYNRQNKGLTQYKKLLNKSKGKYIIIVDDDVIDFPKDFDSTMVKYMENAPDFGFLALDVIQNEHTNGAKPEQHNYTDVERNGYIISKGPTGGWCVILRQKDYKKIKFKFNFSKLNMAKGEDGKLSQLLSSKLNLKSGLLKDICCFHASGPYYSKVYNCIERDILKYRKAGLDEFVEKYEKI
jgi:glycosyltransferase involved in cell wall biosynthesis